MGSETVSMRLVRMKPYFEYLRYKKKKNEIKSLKESTNWFFFLLKYCLCMHFLINAPQYSNVKGGIGICLFSPIRSAKCLKFQVPNSPWEKIICLGFSIKKHEACPCSRNWWCVCTEVNIIVYGIHKYMGKDWVTLKTRVLFLYMCSVLMDTYNAKLLPKYIWWM